MTRRLIKGSGATLALLGAIAACSSNNPSDGGPGPSEKVGAIASKLTSPLSYTKSRLGTFKDGAWSLDVNGNGVWNGCAVDRCLSFGSPGEIPLAGDWSGDGVVSVGTYSPSSNTFFLDWNHDGMWSPGIDKVYAGFVGADPANKPVAGKWTVGAPTTIGMYRNGFWWLDKDGDGVYLPSVDLTGSFGSDIDSPVVGGWKFSLGTDWLGTFRGQANQWFLDLDNSRSFDPAKDLASGSFGLATDKPVAGLWRSSTTASIGVFRDGAWYLDGNGNRTWDNDCNIDDCVTSFGSPGDSPVVGAWAPIQWSRGPNVDVGNNGHWEETAAAVAPNVKCQQGRALLSYGLDQKVFRADLACLETGTCSSPPQVDTNWESQLTTSEWNGTDNQTIRIGTDVYAYRMIGKSDLSMKARVNIAINRSSDCGGSWERWSTIDTASPFMGGDCSMMQFPTTLAVYSPSTKTLYLDNMDYVWDTSKTVVSGQGTDKAIDLTAPKTDFKIAAGDVIIAGNWGGIGTKPPSNWFGVGADKSGPTTALGKFHNGTWLLDTNRNFKDDGCTVDLCATFGKTGDIPLVGRFKTFTGEDNDARGQIGVFRPSTGTWIFDSNGNFVEDASDVHFDGFGMVGDIPVVGDWHNTGQRGRAMRAAVFRPSTGAWYFDQGPDGWQGCGVDECPAGAFGDASMKPVAGVWAEGSDFRDTIGMFKNGVWSRDMNADNNWDPAGGDDTQTLGTPTSNLDDVPLPGFWNSVPGGFDRFEVYSDPYKAVTYVTASCNGHNGSAILAYSGDGAQTWTAQTLPHGWPPLTITSTPNRTYLFGLEGENPMLIPVTADHSLGSPLSVAVGKPWYVFQNHGAFKSPQSGLDDAARYVDADKIVPGGMEGGENIEAVGNSGTSDALLVAYHSVAPAPDHEVSRVMRVKVSGTSSLTVTTSAVATIEGEYHASSSPWYSHVTQPSLIQGDTSPEYSVLYWKEIDLGQGNAGPTVAKMRAAVLRVPFSAASNVAQLDLSTDAAGASRSWLGYTGVTGDYQKGAAYTSGGLQKFLTQWIEDSKPPHTHTAVVSVHP